MADCVAPIAALLPAIHGETVDPLVESPRANSGELGIHPGVEDALRRSGANAERRGAVGDFQRLNLHVTVPTSDLAFGAAPRYGQAAPGSIQATRLLVPFAPKTVVDRCRAFTSKLSASAKGPEAPPKFDAEVGIIGAGAAGLTAARTLIDAGVPTVVWEARPDIGGRARQEKLSSGTEIAPGAQYLQSAFNDDGTPYNPLTKKALEKNVKITKVTLDTTMILGDHLATGEEVAAFNNTVEQYEQAIDNAARRGDVSVESVLPKGLPFEDLAKAKLGALEYAVQLKDLSSAYVRSDNGLNGNDAVVEGGLLAVILANVGQVPVQTNTAVSKVERINFKGKPFGYKVTAYNQTFVVKYVISTVPPSVLTSGKIQIEPALPDWKVKALNASKMGLLNKVVIELDDEFDFQYNGGPVQPANEEVLLQSEPAAPPVSVLMRPNGKPMMIGFVGGEEAKRLEKEKSDDEMVKYFTNKLQPAFKSRIDTHIKATLVTHWGREGGSYSYIEPGKNHMRPLLAKPVDDMLFAGEYTDPTFLQQVTAAAHSGERAAKEILAKRRKAKHPSLSAQTPANRAQATP